MPKPLPTPKICLCINNEPPWPHDISVHLHDNYKHLQPSTCQEPCLCPTPHYSHVVILTCYILVLLSTTFLNLLKQECYLHSPSHPHSFLGVHISLTLPFYVSLSFLEYLSPICYPCTYYSSCRMSFLFCLCGLLQILSSIRLCSIPHLLIDLKTAGK